MSITHQRPPSDHHGVRTVVRRVSETPADPLVVPAPAPWLAWRVGGALRRFELSSATSATLGRAAGRDIVLDDPTVSRLHATVLPIEGLSLVRDEGSTSGTFLNGLRLSPATLVSLRPGDALVLGETRLWFACDPGDVPFEARVEPVETLVPLADLQREGLAALRAADAVEESRLEVLRAFADVSADVGLERYLVEVARRVGADRVAVFLRSTARPEPALLAAYPSRDEAARRLESAALRVPDASCGLVRRAPPEARPCPGQAVSGSVAVVPFASGPTSLGLLAAERQGRTLLDRRDLALLAVLGERIAWARAMRRASGTRDTRPMGLD